MIKEHYKHNRHTWLGMLTHVIVLLIVFILPEVVFTTLMDHRPFGPRQFVIYANTLIYIITFYINYFFLIDRLLFKRKNIWLYVIVTLIITLAMVALCTFSQQIIHFFFDNSQQFANRDRQDHHHMSRFIGKVTRDYVMLLLTIGLSLALKLSFRWNSIEKMNKQIISEQREMELRNLQNQLNPHFLFNTLNNIYALTAINPGKAQEAIHQLSKLLRYSLYESNDSEVTLDGELQFLRSYINLMSLRLSSNNTLKADIYEGDTHSLSIAPMMFIPLIENAFKHGISTSGQSSICIMVNLEGCTIRCHVENSYYPKNGNDHSGSGIGLRNLQRQLKLRYHDNYDYSSITIGDRYVAELSITLTPKDNG